MRIGMILGGHFEKLPFRRIDSPHKRGFLERDENGAVIMDDPRGANKTWLGYLGM
jgi:hypothetical protein